MQESEDKITEISDRILKLIEALGVNPNAFAVALGYRRSQTIYDIVNGKSKPSFDFFNKLANSEYADTVDLRWVLTGRGSVFREPSAFAAQAAGSAACPGSRSGASYLEGHGTIDARVADLSGSGGLKIGMRRIPLYEPTVPEGIFARFDRAEQAPVCYLQMPDLPSCDGAMVFWGDSMRPLLERGDIVLFEWVRDPACELIWGKVYLLELLVEGREYVAIRRIESSGDLSRIRLTGADPDSAPCEIPVACVRARALVRGSIRCNRME